MNYLKTIAIAWPKLQLKWQDIPAFTTHVETPCIYAINPEDETRLRFVIMQMMATLKSEKSAVHAIVIDAPSAWQKEITDALGEVLASEKETHLLEKLTHFIQNGKIENKEDLKSFFEKHIADIAFYTPLTIITAAYLAFMFISYEAENFTSLEKFAEPWSDVLAPLAEQPVYIQFVSFFIAALTTSSPLLAYLLLQNPDPSMPIETEDAIFLSQEMSSAALFGHIDPSKTGNQKVDTLPYLLKANQGVVGMPYEMVAETLSQLADLISGPTAGKFHIGQSATFSTEFSTLMAIFKAKENTAETEAVENEALKRITQSSRLLCEIDLTLIHPPEDSVKVRILQIIKADLDLCSHGKDAVSFSTLISDDSIPDIFEALKISNWIKDTEQFGFLDKDSIIFIPEITNVIYKITENHFYKHGNTKIPADKFTSALELALHKDPLSKTISTHIQKWAAESPISLPTLDLAQTQQRIIFESPTEGTKITIRLQQEFLHRQNGFETHQYIQGLLLHQITPHFDSLEKDTKTLFHSIPTISNSNLAELLDIDPFALITGQDPLIKNIIEAIDTHVAALKDYFDNPHPSKKRPILTLLLKDKGELGKDEYSSGKTSIAKAADKYLEMQYKAYGLNTRNAQKLHRKSDNTVSFTTEKPDGKAPDGLGKKISNFIKDHYPAIALVAAKDLPLLVLNIALEYYFQKNEFESFEDGYSQQFFPWTLYLVTQGISVIVLGAKDALEKEFLDQTPTTLDAGTLETNEIYTLDHQTRHHEFFGTAKHTVKKPQAAFSQTPKLEIIAANGRRTLFIENLHAMSETQIKELFHLINSQQALLGDTIKMDFHVGMLAMTANGCAANLYEAFSGLKHLSYGETSVFQHLKDEEDSKIKKAFLLLQLKPLMGLEWTNEMIDILLDKLIVNDNLFFGVRHIQILIREAEYSAHHRHWHALKQGVLVPIEIQAADIDFGLEKLKTNSTISALFSAAETLPRTRHDSET